MGKVTEFPDIYVGEYEPVEFLGLVAKELKKRPPMVSSIVLALDSEGKFTIHTSSTDQHLNNLMLRLGERHVFEELCEIVAEGFEREE